MNDMGQINDYKKTWTPSGTSLGTKMDGIPDNISLSINNISFLKRSKEVKVSMEFRDMMENVREGFKRIYGNKK